jgi:hypothetical protein
LPLSGSFSIDMVHLGLESSGSCGLYWILSCVEDHGRERDSKLQMCVEDKMRLTEQDQVKLQGNRFEIKLSLVIVSSE